MTRTSSDGALACEARTLELVEGKALEVLGDELGFEREAGDFLFAAGALAEPA
jgi:hypothetical protein